MESKKLRSYSLKTQTIINSTGSLVLMGCIWLISVMIVRITGLEDAGVFALAMSIANVFSFLVNYGMRDYLVADINFAFQPKQYVYARLALSPISFAFCIFYLLIFGFSAFNMAAVLIYLFFNICTVISDILLGNIQRAGHLEITGFSNCFRGFLCLLFFVIVHLSTKSLLLSMSAMSLASLLVLIFFDIPFFRMLAHDKTNNQHQPFYKLFVICFAVCFSNITPIINTAIPRLEVENIMGEKMLGIYSSVYTPMVVLNTLIPSILLAIVPSLTKHWKEFSIKSLRKTIFYCYSIVFTITIIANIGVFFVGKFFLNLLYGEEVASYSSLLYPIIVSMGLYCMCVCGNYILIAIESRFLLAVFSAIGVVITLLLSRLFVSSYGLVGAVLPLAVAYSFQSLMQLVLIIVRVRLRNKNA